MSEPLSQRLSLAAIALRAGPLDMREAHRISVLLELAAEAVERLEKIEARYEEKWTYSEAK